MKQVTVLLTTLGLVACIAATVQANSTQLITNGTFTATGGGSTGETATGGQLGYANGGSTPFNATGWTNTSTSGTLGYNFLFTSGTQAVTGVPGNGGNLPLWSGSVGGPDNITVDPIPGGGSFLGNDGAYQTSAVQTTVSGLTVGKTYTLTFDWAAAQQHGYNGITTDYWAVTFGSQTFDTSTITLPSNGFSGWQSDTMTFIPTSASQTLSFLAYGTPSGEPPFALLTDVSMIVPEPSSVVAMFIGMLGLAAMVGFRIKSMKLKA